MDKLSKKDARTLVKVVKRLAKQERDIEKKECGLDFTLTQERVELNKRKTNQLGILDSLSRRDYDTGKYAQMYSEMVARGEYDLITRLKYMCMRR